MRWGILFAGVDGVGWGLEVAGHTPVWAVEMDPLAAEYHRRNHPHTRCLESDVQAVDVSELPNIDALWASPPCQGHSQARRKDLPQREDVWVGRDILRYAAELSPRVVMIENVPKYQQHAVFREIVAGLERLGYTVAWRVLNAADYGVPQTRERLIVQARKDGRIGWPQPTRRVGWYEAIKDILPPPDRPLAPWQAKRWRAAYASLNPILVDGQFAYACNAETQANLLTVRKSDEPGMTLTANTDRMDIVYPLLLDGQFKYGDDVQNVIPAANPAPCVMASDHSRKDIVYPLIIDNQLRWDEGEGFMRLEQAHEPCSTVMASTGSNKDVVYPLLVSNQLFGENEMRMAQHDEPAQTVLADHRSNKDVLYPAPLPMRARLTARCAARLQTLPDSAIWPDTFTAAIKLIGNAVPSLLAQRLAEALETPAVWNVSLWEGAVA